MPACKVQDADEEGDEHVALVHLRHRIIHDPHDGGGIVFVGGNGAEKASGDCHHQRCGDALAANVSYAEYKFLVPDVEVVQVSSYLLRRHDRSRHIEVFPLGEGREDLGNHRHLYGTGDAELVLHTLLALVEFLELLLVFCGREQDDYNHRDAQHLQQRDKETYLAYPAEDLLVRDDDGDGPAGLVDGGGENVVFLVFGQGAGISHHIFAGTADKGADCIGIGPGADHEVVQPVQGDVCGEHRHESAVRGLQRHGVGGHQNLSAALVHIGLGPITISQFQRLGEPFLGRVVVFLGRQAGNAYRAFSRSLEAIRREERALPVVAGHQGDGGPDDDGIILHHAPGHRPETVRHAEGPLSQPDAVVHCDLGLVNNVQNLQFGNLQAAFGALSGFFANAFLREVVLDEPGGFQGDGRDDDQHQALYYRTDKFHRMGLSASRNSGMGQLESRSMMRVLSPA